MLRSKQLAVVTIITVMVVVFWISVAEGPSIIVLDPHTTYQTITGWEATAQSGQLACDPPAFGGSPIACPAFLKYQDALHDAIVNDLGINRLRVEVYSAIENTTDYYTQYLQGQITEREWVHVYGHQIINDNSDGNVINVSGFQFSMLDHQIDTVVLPTKQRVEARGERFFLNACYLGGDDPAEGQHWINPPEYAEFVLATYQHLQRKYGFVPDTWEVSLEPDNTPFSGSQMGQAIQATAALLQAAGFTPRFVVPSTTNMANTKDYFEAIRAVIGDSGVRQFVAEISYHRYAGVSESNLRWISETAQAYGIGSAMLEHMGSGYADLHQDLKVGHNTAWSQYTIAAPFYWSTTDEGGAYYRIDDTNVSSPTIIMAARTKFLRQYFRFIRTGAQRIGAEGDSAFDPVAFINRDGGYVVVIKAAAGGAFAIRGLPVGTYGLKYTTSDAYDADLPDAVLGAGQLLNASIPAGGVITVYAKSMSAQTPSPSSLAATPTRGGGTATPMPGPSPTGDKTHPRIDLPFIAKPPSPLASVTPVPPSTPKSGPLEWVSKSVWEAIQAILGGD